RGPRRARQSRPRCARAAHDAAGARGARTRKPCGRPRATAVSSAATMAQDPPRRVSLATKILIGLLLGAAAGLACNLAFPKPAEGRTSLAYDNLVWFADRVMNPIGQVFLRMLFMVVVPLVFSSLVLGVASVGDVRRVGKIGARTLAWFVGSTAAAVSIGLLMVNTFTPGLAMDPATAAELRQQFAQDAAAKIEQGRE